MGILVELDVLRMHRGCAPHGPVFYTEKDGENLQGRRRVASVASGVCTSANQASCCDTLVRSEQRRPKKNFIRAAWNRREADTMRLFTHCRFLFWPRATPLLPSLGS